MARTIDYALARGCRVLSVRAVGKRGSDHRLVIFVVQVAGVTFRVGLWNVRRDRNRHRVTELVYRVLTLFDLDVLALCEAQDYATALHRRGRRDGHNVIQWTDVPGQAHQALIVRNDVLTIAPRLHLMTRTGWRTVRGGGTDPKWAPTVRVSIAGRSLRVVVGHRPPTQRWRAGRMRGPIRRVIATVQHARAEVRVLNAITKPLLYVADFNAEPHTRGRWSPRWVAEQTGATIHAPQEATHG